MALLEIKDLYASVEGKQILKGVNLEINDKETVALLGPNGHGKSTLLMVLMGHPKYKIDSGSITFNGEDLTKMSVDERSRAGLFLGMQYPSEVPGVINADFLKAAVNVREQKPLTLFQFYKVLNSASSEVKIPFEMANRSLNEGFSGGEKKRNEILQMLLLNPHLAMLDEIDSGLDVDALHIVSQVLKKEQEKGRSFLIVSHYSKLYENVVPTRVVIMINGRIAASGDVSLIKKIDNKGYEWIKTELGIEIEKENIEDKQISLGTCAIHEASKNVKK